MTIRGFVFLSSNVFFLLPVSYLSETLSYLSFTINNSPAKFLKTFQLLALIGVIMTFEERVN